MIAQSSSKPKRFQNGLNVIFFLFKVILGRSDSRAKCKRANSSDRRDDDEEPPQSDVGFLLSSVDCDHSGVQIYSGT